MIEHGKEVCYYNNGQIEHKCNSINGLLDGEYIKYYEDGRLKDVYEYKDGRRIY